MRGGTKGSDMADKQTPTQKLNGTPEGAFIEPAVRHAVSDGFIDSLRLDGISARTIRSIRRDKAHAQRARPAQA